MKVVNRTSVGKGIDMSGRSSLALAAGNRAAEKDARAFMGGAHA